MGKMNKSDTTPEMEAKAEEFRLAMLANKCQHFAVGTWIMRKNIRGFISAISKDGGLHLIVDWETGGSEVIVNPKYRAKHKERCTQYCPVRS